MRMHPVSWTLVLALTACGRDDSNAPSGPSGAGGATSAGSGSAMSSSVDGAHAGSTGQGTDGPQVDAGATHVSAYTYHQHAKAILDARCVPCHREGGMGPFPLDTLEAAQKYGPGTVSALRERKMPPFPPDDTSCREIDDPRKMSDQERETLIDWASGGVPAGDPQKPSEITIAHAGELLGKPTRRFPLGVEYEPPTSGTDDYRCFLVDPKLTQSWTFLRSLGIDTDNWARVHHAIVYLVPQTALLAAKAQDAAEAGPGWSCYFGTRVDGAIPAGGYAPGGLQRPYPNGTTVPIQAGTQLIVEVHFHNAHNQDPVHVSVASWEFDKPVDKYPDALPMFNSNFVIPKGAASVKAEMRGRIIAADQTPISTSDPNAVHEVKAGLIWGADFHMHMRGKTARVDLVRENGTRECLLYVPRWDDMWQGAYMFKEPIEARAGDHLEATCEWDNTAEHQPIVDGKRLEPVELRWGVNSLDEMCNSSVSITH